ncbi:MAG: DsbC family protein [Nitrospirota bacterium]
MKKLFLLIGLLYSLLYIPDVHAFGGCEENCQKCHTLENKEVQEILARFNAPNAKVMGIQMSPIKGLWEVSIEDNGKMGIMYIGFSKKYIMGGNIFEVETSANKTNETLSRLNQSPGRFVDTSRILLDNGLLMGDKNAAHKVVVFTDPDCPFCGKLHDEMKKALTERKDIAFYIMLMPLKFHPDAYWKSQSILCSRSLKLLEDNFEKKPIPKPGCAAKGVDENIKLAAELGITGTPTLIMPDGLVVVGAIDADTIIKHVLTPAKKGDKK